MTVWAELIVDVIPLVCLSNLPSLPGPATMTKKRGVHRACAERQLSENKDPVNMQPRGTATAA